MPGIPQWLYDKAGQPVTVEPYEGASAIGEVYGPPVTITMVVDHKRRLVRTASGVETVASTTLYGPLSANVPAQSHVTLADGRRITVITSHPHDGKTLPVPSHLEVICQ